MAGQQTLVFDPDEDYDYDRIEGVTFWGNDGTKRIRCRITRPTLDDKFGHLELRERAFINNRSAIEELVRRRYFNGYLEPDGSVLI